MDSLKSLLEALKLKKPKPPPPDDPPLFPQFSGLPGELRIKIWKMAVRDLPARIVTPKPKVPGSTIPALLHVNHESRTVALKRFTLLDETVTRRMSINSMWRIPNGLKYIWIVDFDRDYVLVNYRTPIVYRESRRIMVFQATVDQFFNPTAPPKWASKVNHIIIGIRYHGYKAAGSPALSTWRPPYLGRLHRQYFNASTKHFLLHPDKNGRLYDIVPYKPSSLKRYREERFLHQEIELIRTGQTPQTPQDRGGFGYLMFKHKHE